MAAVAPLPSSAVFRSRALAPLSPPMFHRSELGGMQLLVVAQHLLHLCVLKIRIKQDGTKTHLRLVDLWAFPITSCRISILSVRLLNVPHSRCHNM
uniref:Uncharacterized protein n=1 Tax=Arundo donax TaxID=35708 RepID=A0A0A8YN89_ARUDO